MSRNERGFFTECLFLLSLPYENLYEQTDSHGFAFRCKGCSAQGNRKDRKEHYEKHVREELLPDAAELEERIRMQIADEANRLSARIEKHDHEATRAADEYGRAKAKIERLLKPGEMLTPKEHDLVVQADAALKTSTQESGMADRLRVRVDELLQKEEADRRLQRITVQRVGKRRRTRVPRAKAKTAKRSSSGGGERTRVDLTQVPRATANKIVRMFDEGVGGPSIAAKLNADKDTPPGGTRWRRQQVLEVVLQEKGAKSIRDLRKKVPVRRPGAQGARPTSKKKAAAKPNGNGIRALTGRKKNVGPDPKPTTMKRSARGKVEKASMKTGGRKRAGRAKARKGRK